MDKNSSHSMAVTQRLIDTCMEHAEHVEDALMLDYTLTRNYMRGYGEFQEGLKAFTSKEKPIWKYTTLGTQNYSKLEDIRKIESSGSAT